jgi:hypothetical protein
MHNGLNAPPLTRIEAHVRPQVMILTEKPTPQTGLDGKFPVFHAAAASLLWGKAILPQFTNEVVQNDVVISLRKRVAPVVDDSHPCARCAKSREVMTWRGVFPDCERRDLLFARKPQGTDRISLPTHQEFRIGCV